MKVHCGTIVSAGILSWLTGGARAHCDDREPYGDAAGFRFEDPESPDFEANATVPIDFDFTAFSYLELAEEGIENIDANGKSRVKLLPWQDDDFYGVNTCTNLDPQNSDNPKANVRNPFYFDVYGTDPLRDIEVTLANTTIPSDVDVVADFTLNPCEYLDDTTYSSLDCDQCADLNATEVVGAGPCFIRTVEATVNVPQDECNEVIFTVTGCGGEGVNASEDAINLKKEAEFDPDSPRIVPVCTFTATVSTSYNPCDVTMPDLNYTCDECAEAALQNVTGAGNCTEVDQDVDTDIDANVTVSEIVEAFEVQENVLIPGGVENTTCCWVEDRFLPEGTFSAVYALTDSVTVTVKVSPGTTLGPENAKRFAELCEELFACTQFSSFETFRNCDAAQGRGCTPYRKRSLCFDDMYFFEDQQSNLPLPGDEEKKLRERFIVDSCWGMAANPNWGHRATNGTIIESEAEILPEEETDENRTLSKVEVLMRNLVENLESTCSLAARESDRREFEPSETCINLVACQKLAIETAAAADPKTEAELGKVTEDGIETDPYDICGDLIETEIVAKLEECNDLNSNSADTTGIRLSNSTSESICPAYLKSYFQTFPPDYPSKAKWSVYEDIVLETVENYEGSDTSRTSANKVASLLPLLSRLRAADIVLEAGAEMLPQAWLYDSWKWIPYFASHTSTIVIENLIEVMDFHDGNIDSAEIEAYYENSRQLIDGSAAVFDAVRCRKSLDEDKLFAKWGQGCDSFDNDCDRVVDECDEDRIDPVINTATTAAVCGDKWFGSEDAARECIETTVTAYDDCDPSVTVEVLNPIADECGITTFTVRAETSLCEQVATKEVTVKVADPAVSDITLQCGLQGAPKGDQEVLLLKSTGASTFSDVDLFYEFGTGNDNCPTGDVQVVTKIYANEVEDLRNQEMAAFYKYNDPDKVKAQISTGLCETSSNGQCIRDPNFPHRLYTFRIEVTDETGRSNACEARALVLPPNLFNIKNSDIDVELSKQRFTLTEYKYTIEEDETSEATASFSDFHLIGFEGVDPLRARHVRRLT